MKYSVIYLKYLFRYLSHFVTSEINYLKRNYLFKYYIARSNFLPHHGTSNCEI